MINQENIKKDSIYLKLYELYGEDYVVKAGYFENEAQNNGMTDEELSESLKFPCTPLPKKSDLEYNSIILVTTGCYNPIHDGHIGMMEAAKAHMESLGFHVIKGYFAPDSDDYVKSKSKDYMNIHERINQIYKSTEHIDWLTVDPWAGTFLDTDVNFTAIYRRLQLYVQKYLGVDVPIYYVCGSDRSEFSYTFEDKSIIVQRHTFNSDSTSVFNPIEGDIHPAAHFVIPTKQKLYQSSTAIRDKWDWKPSEQCDLILRVDDYTETYPKDIMRRFYDLLGKSYKSIAYNYSEKQFEYFKRINKQTVSLDTLMSDEYILQISRFFNLGGVEFLGYKNRIGSRPFKEQLKSIPKNVDLYIFDDDSFTGGTIKFANDLLRDHRILGEITLAKSNHKKFEILDCRDFFFGSNCGLAIETPTGEKFRVPYIYPFVDPNIRASLRDPIEFSREMWRILLGITEHSADTTIEKHEMFACLRYVGFAPNTKFSDVCKYYIENL